MTKKILLILFLGLLFCLPQPSLAGPCSTDNDCAVGEYCAGSGASLACAPKLANNAACQTSNQCQSNNCTGGVCAASVATPGTGPSTAGQYDLPNFLNTDEPADLIGRIIKIIVGFCGVIALFMFLYGGTLWLISSGREQYVEKGRDTMLWSAIGLAIVFGSYILVNFVFSFFGK